MKRRGRALVRLLVAGLILAAVFGLVFIWVVQALPHIAIAEISELTNAKIDARSVDFTVGGSVLIENLVIRPDQEQAYDDAILKAQTLYARFSIGSMFLLAPRLKEIHIRDFVFNAQQDLDTGQWNIGALKINVPKNGVGAMPSIHLEEGMLQYGKVSKDQLKILAAIPIDIRFGPAKEILAGYSFDITTAQRGESGESRLYGFWQPGRITVAGAISSFGIPAFEKAWQIELLDATLNYDRSNNFSLKAKIEGLLYRRETGRDTSLAFERPAFLAKSGLFTALQKFSDRYRPAGKVDVDLEASGNFNQLSESTLVGKVYCKDVSICDQNFAYPIEQIAGRVDFTENSVVLNTLSGKHGDVKVTIDGWSKDFGFGQRYQIQITSDNMALDADLYNALSPKQKELWTAFAPSGRAMIDYRFSQQSPTAKKKTLMLELLGAEATYRDFCYPLKNLTGKLLFDRNGVGVSDVVSQVNGGKITFNGRVIEYSSDRPTYYLSIKGESIPFDSALTSTLLAKQSDFYGRFDIRGMADADVKIFTSTEDAGPTSFLAELFLKETSLKVDESPLVVSDVSAEVVVTPDSTSIKSLAGRYGQGLVSLTGGMWVTAKEQPSRYHFALNAKEAQLSDDLINLLPTPLRKVVSEWQPEGKVDVSANLNKAANEDQPNYHIVVDCLSDSVNYRRFAYPLKDVTGRLTITNNTVKLENITATAADSVRDGADKSTPMYIRVNGEIALAGNGSPSVSAGGLGEGELELSASGITFSEQLQAALPKGIASFYQALSPTGRFDVDLENIKIFSKGTGGKYVDFVGSIKFKDCNFNLFGTRAYIEALLNTKGFYEIGSGLSDGQVNLVADTLKIMGKSLTNLKADINYNPDQQNWLSDNLIADFYGGRLVGKLEFKPAAEGPLEYLLETAFGNADLRRFLSDSRPPETSENTYSSGVMNGALSISARVGEGSSRLGRFRLAVRDMQVGKLSPLAKLLYTLQLKEQKDFAFGRMVIDSYIKHDQLFFEKLDLSGEAVAFYGTGWMDLQSENVDLTLTARGERLVAAEPSIMQSLAEGLGSAMVRMQVTGNVHDSKVETRTLPVIEDSLQILGTRRMPPK